MRKQELLPLWIRNINFQPEKANCKLVRFYKYPSWVMKELFVQNHNYKTEHHDALKEFGSIIQEEAILQGAGWDNKVVIELLIDDKTIYVGFKDGLIKIGLGVYSETNRAFEFTTTDFKQN